MSTRTQESWTLNRYEADHDARQRMALAVAWKSRCTQVIRHDHTLRAQYMGDILQTAMLAAYESPTLKDSEAVWFRKYRHPDTGELVTEIRESVQKLSPEKLAERVQYKHIERAVRREIKRVLNLHGKAVPLNPEVETPDDEQLTATRVYDTYLRDCPGNEWDRLDYLLEHAAERLYPTHAQLLRRLVAGETTLAQLNSRTREALRQTVLQVLHMRA